MKCFYVGFKIAMGPKVNRKKIEATLIARNGEACQFRGRSRIFSVAKSGDYIVGRWWLLKGDTSFIQYNRTVDTASLGTLAPGCEMAACNYFVINLTSWHGLYQQSRSSAAMRDFCDYLISRTSQSVKSDYSNATKEAGGRKKISSDKLKRIQEDYSYLWHVLFTQEKFERLLKNFDKMVEVFYTIATIKPSSVEHGPLAGDLRAEIHRLKLATSVETQQVGRSALIGRVMEFFEWLKKKRGGVVEQSGVVGIQNNNQRTIKIGDILERFGENRLDEVMTKEELAISDLRKSALIVRLISIAEDNEAYFGKGAS